MKKKLLNPIGILPLKSFIRVFGRIGYIAKRECGYTFVYTPDRCLQIPDEYFVEKVIRMKKLFV